MRMKIHHWKNPLNMVIAGSGQKMRQGQGITLTVMAKCERFINKYPNYNYESKSKV